MRGSSCLLHECAVPSRCEPKVSSDFGPPRLDRKGTEGAPGKQSSWAPSDGGAA